MKKINLSLYRKEIISILAGVIILLFPDILSKSVNYAGFIIIIISLVMMLANILFKKKSSRIFGDCMGIFIGIFVIFLSDFIKNGIPMLIGIAAIVIGIKISANIISGAKSGRKVGFNIIPGILLTAAGILFFFFYPYILSKLKRIVAVILILCGIVSIIIKLNKTRFEKASDEIIEIKGFSVHDDE